MRLGKSVGFIVAAGILLTLPVWASPVPISDTLTVNGTSNSLVEVGDTDQNPVLSQLLPAGLATLLGISNIAGLNATASAINGLAAPTMVQFLDANNNNAVSDQIIAVGPAIVMISDSSALIHVPFVPEPVFAAIPFSTVVSLTEPAAGLTADLSSTFNNHTVFGTNSIIAFSDGDVSTVPEPPSAVLMLFGLVLIGAPYLWRRKTWTAED